MQKSIKLNYVFNLLLNISKVLFPLITAPYVSRILEPDGIGLANFAGTYASYFAMFASLGVANYGIREIAKRKNDISDCSNFVSQIFSIEIITTAIVTVIYLATLLFLDQFNENILLFIISGIGLYLTPFSVEWFFSGREEFAFITFRSLVIKIIFIILLFIVVHTKDDLIKYVILGALSSVANQVWNFIKLYRSGVRIRFTQSGLRIHLKPILLLFASSIAISIYTSLDTLMLGLLNNYTEVGYYTQAMRLVHLLLPVATSLSIVAMPRVSSYIKEGKLEDINELMNKSASLVSFLAFPLSLGIISIAPEFVPAFFGQAFYGSILPMQIGSLIIIAIGLNNLNGVQILIGLGKDKLFLYSVCSGAITNFILNMVLMQKYGAVGAAISTVTAEFLILFVNEYFVRTHTSVKVTNFSDVIKSLIGSLAFIPICFCIGNYTSGWAFVFSAFMVCVIIYAIMEYMLRNKMLYFITELLVSRISNMRNNKLK